MIPGKFHLNTRLSPPPPPCEMTDTKETMKNPQVWCWSFIVTGCRWHFFGFTAAERERLVKPAGNMYPVHYLDQEVTKAGALVSLCPDITQGFDI